jgi:hypothetical protein
LLTTIPAQITMQIYFQPIGLDVLNDLVATGDLDAGLIAAMPTLTVGPQVVWTLAAAQASRLSFADPNSNNLVQCVSNTAYNAAAANVYGNPPVALAVAKANCSP